MRRPDPDELSVGETQWLIAASRQLPVDFLWTSSEILPDMSKGEHSYWYSHPWMSSDLLVQFLFQARPSERGLLKYEQEFRLWYFPSDYPEQVSKAIERLKENGPNKYDDAGP